jgi:hypothetical protein
MQSRGRLFKVMPDWTSLPTSSWVPKLSKDIVDTKLQEQGLDQERRGLGGCPPIVASLTSRTSSRHMRNSGNRARTRHTWRLSR